MFRRKEESLFDNEFTEENESFSVVQPASEDTPVAANTQSSVVAPSTASVQPITRPAAPVPVASVSSYRPASSVTATPVSNPITRPAEGKPMTSSLNPLSSSHASQSISKPGNRILTVGNDILLKGEITTCDRLVVEGKVEATISDVNTIELAECGSFKGSANVVEAQISGLFEGDLIVTGRLVIYASGKVRGNVTYGEIEIERGGELSGQIKASAASSSQSSLPKALQKAAA